MLLVLLLVFKVGAVFVGGPQDLRTGEVMVMCPLSEDARKTRRSVVISHSNQGQPIPDTMLGCFWLTQQSHNPDCRSRVHFTLVSLTKDYVMARVPRAQLHKDGFYQCQLVPPPDADHAFSRCLVFDNDDTEDPSTTISPVIPSTADDLRHPGNDTEKVSTSADGGSPRGNYAADVTPTLLVVILIVVISGLFGHIFLLHRKYGQNVQQLPAIPHAMDQQLRIIAQRLSDIVQAMEQQSRLQGNGAKDSRDLPGDVKAVSALNHSSSFKDNGATVRRKLPGDEEEASDFVINDYRIEKKNGVTDVKHIPGDEDAANVWNHSISFKKNGVTDVRDIPGDEDAANVWNHSNRFKRNGVTDIRDLRGDGEPMYGITPTGLRRTESQTPENSLDMYMDMLSIYGTTPTALSTIAQHEAEINLETAQQLSKGRQRTSWIGKSSKGERQTSETSLEMELQPLSATPKRGRSRELPSPKEVTGKQFRREVPKRTSLTATKALLKTGQDKRLPVTMVA